MLDRVRSDDGGSHAVMRCIMVGPVSPLRIRGVTKLSIGKYSNKLQVTKDQRSKVLDYLAVASALLACKPPELTTLFLLQFKAEIGEMYIHIQLHIQIHRYITQNRSIDEMS